MSCLGREQNWRAASRDAPKPAPRYQQIQPYQKWSDSNAV
jgi:hypothetical protein